MTFPDGDPTGDTSSVADVPERRRGRAIATRAIEAIKAQHQATRSPLEAIADLLNAAAASSAFLTIHLVWFGVWMAWNLGAFGLEPFDPFPFGFLTLVVSLEAIFLSIFVLMAQKRESGVAELREELILQVSLRMEEEVTKTLQLVSGLYTRLGYPMSQDDELGDMLQPLNVSGIERKLAEQIGTSTNASTPKVPRRR